MVNSTTFTNCQDKLKSLIKYYRENHNTRNEATTRHQLIDILIHDCLNWNRQNTITEDRTNNGQYTDYTLKIDGKNRLILEAKREANYFELHAGNNNIKYSIKTLCDNNPNTEEAINQVLNYCSQKGAEYAVICNGW